MSRKTCGTCGHVTTEVTCRLIDEDGHELHETSDPDATACNYWIERTDGLEQVAREMLDEIGGMEITNLGGKETPIADDYADRLRALGVEVEE